MNWRVTAYLDESMENVRYFGRGPRENYSDSKETGLMGVYENTVDGLFTNYVVPQANGNHMDCKWVSLTNDRGMGLVASTEDSFNFQHLMKKRSGRCKTHLRSGKKGLCSI